MRFGRSNDGTERLLSVVLAEARRQRGPELDWQAIEARLDRAVQLPSPTPKARRPSLFALSLIPTTALAAAAAALFLATPRPAEPVANAEARSESERNGDSLAADELVVADEKAVTVAHPGRARWTLEPNSRALVLAHGDVVLVRLVAGAMKADVVPNPKAERFVVEAAGTRVAVHGTVFRVQLQGERARVDVERGVVSVGPRERPEQVTATLRAPAHAEFTLEGGAVSPLNTASAVPQPGRAATPVRASCASCAQLKSPERVAQRLPKEGARHPLTIGEAEAGVAAAVEAISRCFQLHTEGSHAVQVSAATELTLEISDAGTVTDVTFVPPLSPLVQSCAERGVLAVQFAPSSEGAHITRTLELTR